MTDRRIVKLEADQLVVLGRVESGQGSQVDLGALAAWRPHCQEPEERARIEAALERQQTQKTPKIDAKRLAARIDEAIEKASRPKED